MSERTEKAILAGGCFWGMQDLIRKMAGVISTRVGYSGGDVRNATYRNHGTHAEAIEIIFDPRVLSYKHGRQIPKGPANSFRFNAGFFDGHVETMGDLEGADPALWNPKGTSITAHLFNDVATRFFGGQPSNAIMP